MKKGSTLFAVLWAVLGLGLLVGLPVAIHFILGQYDEAGFSGPQLVFEEQGHSYLAFTLDDYRANEVDNGVVHGSSRSYAQVVDLEDGSLRWSARLDADNERGDDWGSGELLGQRRATCSSCATNSTYSTGATPPCAGVRRAGAAHWRPAVEVGALGEGRLSLRRRPGRIADARAGRPRLVPRRRQPGSARSSGNRCRAVFPGRPAAAASAGIAWQAPGLTRLPDDAC